MINKNIFSELSECLIIAEIGVNHNGDISMAKKLIDVAKTCGANAVKFQTFRAEKLASINTPKVAYQKESTNQSESHYEMLKKLELSYDDHFILKTYCESKKILFLSTPYDADSANFLNNDLDIEMFKTASADIVDHSLHEHISKSKKPTIISVGMASLGEIEETLKIYEKNNNNQVILLHCVSNYPCSNQSLNMNVINTLKNTFYFPVGFSDHSVGNEAAILSIAMGSKVIEKHLTLDKSLPGPDHKASSSPDEFLTYVNAIRKSEQMMGSYTKKIQSEELGMAKVSRKSPVLNKDLLPGDILCDGDIDFIRPADGIKPYMAQYILGKKARKHIKKGQLLSFFDFE